MKRYLIAGLTVDMEISGRTELQAKAYAVSNDGPANITINCDARRVLALNPQMGTEDMAQYIATGMLFSRQLLKFDGTFLHASAVVLDGRAYLFSASSGTGKSTHTQKWCRLFGATYLNDDKPALRLVDGGWMAYGTPWSGKNDLSTPVGVPVGGIAFLERGQKNEIYRLDPKDAVPLFLRQSLWKLDPEQMQQHLSLVDKLIRQVPIWHLACRNEDAAAEVSRAAMVAEMPAERSIK